MSNLTKFEEALTKNIIDYVCSVKSYRYSFVEGKFFVVINNLERQLQLSLVVDYNDWIADNYVIVFGKNRAYHRKFHKKICENVLDVLFYCAKKEGENNSSLILSVGEVFINDDTYQIQLSLISDKKKFIAEDFIKKY